jgi:cation-transporting P-type ATPase 13A2
MADVGISLSQAEASIAAPFTSNIIDIRAVVLVLREGRAALSTAFQAFKYLCLYSLIETSGLMLLYLNGLDYSGN